MDPGVLADLELEIGRFMVNPLYILRLTGTRGVGGAPVQTYIRSSTVLGFRQRTRLNPFELQAGDQIKAHETYDLQVPIGTDIRTTDIVASGPLDVNGNPFTLNWLGDWVSATTYAVGDTVIVQSGGLFKAYVARTTSTGANPVASPVQWLQITVDQVQSIATDTTSTPTTVVTVINVS